MRIWVQKSASMQKRTSPLKFGDLAEKSGLNSVSNLSTKVPLAAASGAGAGARAAAGGAAGRMAGVSAVMSSSGVVFSSGCSARTTDIVGGRSRLFDVYDSEI